MDNYKKYYGIIAFCIAIGLIIFGGVSFLNPKFGELATTKDTKLQKEQELAGKKNSLTIVQNKIKKIKSSISSSQKKIYSPVETDLGNETLFFTLYNDVIEMLHANSVKIKAIDYTYNPSGDSFVEFGKNIYFVCDVDMELVSNYVNLGKFIQDVYQYPYYIRINNIEVKPYEKDKKILLSKVSLRLYAHTSPEEESTEETGNAVDNILDNADTALPQ